MNSLARHARRGISMAETIVASLLVGMVLVSTIQIVGPTVRSTGVQADRLVAANLANELSEEIATKLWTSPILDDPDSIGPGAGETRKTFDDIDDYNGWSSSPPMLGNETSNTALLGWTRSAAVTHCEVDDPSLDAVSYTGLKRVTVTVSKNGVTLAQVVSLHAAEADTLGLVVSDGGS